MSTAKIALIIITAPPQEDMTRYWGCFREYPVEDFKGDAKSEIREIALNYLADKIEHEVL